MFAAPSRPAAALISGEPWPVVAAGTERILYRGGDGRLWVMVAQLQRPVGAAVAGESGELASIRAVRRSGRAWRAA